VSFRDRVARGLPGVALVTSGGHAGLVEAIGASLPGADWQRWRAGARRELGERDPEKRLGLVKALLQLLYDEPDAEAVHAQLDRALDTLAAKRPKWPSTSTALEPTSWPSPQQRPEPDQQRPATPRSARRRVVARVPLIVPLAARATGRAAH
jgi:hypothetical protein